jgi:hypothetical protein
MNASRKKDRESIAAMFQAAADKFGASVERRESPRNPGYSGASIDLTITLNGVGVQVSIDDLHGPGEGMASWYNARKYSPPEPGYPYGKASPCRNFSPSFNVAVGDLSHARPHHKATSYDAWDVLAAKVQAGLRHAANNTAFVQEERN